MCCGKTGDSSCPSQVESIRELIFGKTSDGEQEAAATAQERGP